jgi:hypothetical protein
MSPGASAAVLSLAMAMPLGIGLGLLYFTAVHRTAQACLARGVGAHMLVLTLARVTLAATAFILLAHLGSVVLLGAFVGFLTARTICIRRYRGAT